MTFIGPFSTYPGINSPAPAKQPGPAPAPDLSAVFIAIAILVCIIGSVYFAHKSGAF